MQLLVGPALFGVIVFAFLAGLHAFVWLRQRSSWSVLFAMAYVALTLVYALDHVLQPVNGRPNLLSTLLAVPATTLVTIGMVDFTRLQGRIAITLRAVPVVAGLLLIALVAAGQVTRLTVFSSYGAFLGLQAALAAWAMVKEPRSGHGFVFISLLLYPCVLAMVGLGWVDLAALRYVVIAPGAMLGTTLLTIGLVRAQRAASEELQRRSDAESRVHHLAFYDALTDLPNRRLLLDRLAHAVASNTRRRQHGALLCLDLDNFKTINDSMGHEKGDMLLRQVADRLRQSLRDVDTTGRLGGDEFVVLLEDLSPNFMEACAQAQGVADKLLHALSQPYLLGQHSTPSSASIGVAMFNEHDRQSEEVLKRADLAMYQAKTAGRNGVRFFSEEVQAAVAARAELEIDLHQALRDKQFELYLQPQVDDRGEVVGAEALIRWRHPVRGMVSPVNFIPVAEESHLIVSIGTWVLEEACQLLARWAAHPELAGLTLSINVSVRQFRHFDFLNLVLDHLQISGANPHRLKLELTESILVDDVANTIAKMRALQDQGLSFALDDFGTGYSSLTYLKTLPLDQLKIDQSFVRAVLTDPSDAAIARTIVDLAQSLGLLVVAEGVETEEQRAFLQECGCRHFQGYLFGRPVPAQEFTRAQLAYQPEHNDLPFV